MPQAEHSNTAYLAGLLRTDRLDAKFYTFQTCNAELAVHSH